MKVCYECSCTNSPRYFDYTITVPDEYGMACSEPGVPTHMEIPIHICEDCELMAEGMDQLVHMNR